MNKLPFIENTTERNRTQERLFQWMLNVTRTLSQKGERRELDLYEVPGRQSIAHDSKTNNMIFFPYKINY